MKKILLAALVAFTMLSCNQGVTVSFDDSKSSPRGETFINSTPLSKAALNPSR